MKDIIKHLFYYLFGYKKYAILKTYLKVKIGLYREREVSILDTIINSGDYCFDIGANCGEYSYYLSKIVGRTGKIISVEPYSKNIEVMESIFKTSKINNTIILNLALSDHQGKANLVIKRSNKFIHGEAAYLNCAKITQEENTLYETVKVDTIDNIIKKLNISESRISFIKCDVEGSEYSVFKGGHYLLSKIRPIVLVEVWFSNRRERMLKLFKQYEYTQRYLLNGSLVELLDEKQITQNNLYNCFFVPIEKMKIF